MREVAEEAVVDFFLDDQRAEIPVTNGGRIVVEREPARVIFATRELLGAEELLHPYLAYAAGIFGRWLGRLSLHAGAVVVSDGAWAVLGPRESGKSSTLAWLAQAGFGVLCDDVLVLDRMNALAGPRVVDLRAETAAELGAGEPLGVIGARERWRLPLDAVEPELPLRGVIFLAWGDDVAATPVAAPERVLRLASELMVRLAPPNPAALLDLAGLPCWELRRPHGLGSLDATGGRLLDLAGV